MVFRGGALQQGNLRVPMQGGFHEGWALVRTPRRRGRLEEDSSSRTKDKNKKSREGMVILKQPKWFSRAWKSSMKSNKRQDRDGGRQRRDCGLGAITAELLLGDLRPRNNMIREFRRIIEAVLSVAPPQTEGCGRQAQGQIMARQQSLSSLGEGLRPDGVNSEDKAL